MDTESACAQDTSTLTDESRRVARHFRWAIAFVWLATAVCVFHPGYQAIGAHYLGLLGLPLFLMYGTCAAEFALGLRVALGSADRRITTFQVCLIGAFTILLAIAEPRMLAHPFGMLSKNLPLLALIIVACRLEDRGWDSRGEWILRGGMAVIWITEGLFPKILFQVDMEVEIVRQSGLAPCDPAVFLAALGAAQVLSGIAVLILRGKVRQWILAIQFGALVILPLLVAWQMPDLLVHPFGPITKNIPILVGTWTLLTVPGIGGQGEKK